MASGSTISVTFKVTDADGSWKKLTADADGFKKVVESTLAPVGNLQKKVINWTAASQALSNMQTAVSNLQSFMGGLTKAYDIQIQNETRLAAVMRQRMNASEADIQSMKNLASAQQEVGIIGDEVQLAGMQQIATFATQKSTVETLTPAMNNLIAQQKGLNATEQDAQSIGNLFGKALQGQVSALKRVGISFTDAEANVLKYGTEEERAAMLAQVVQNNVGSMNQTLAQTDVGQQKQMANALGDVQEQIGGMLEPIAGVVAGLAQMGFMVTNITQLATSFAAVGTALKAVVTLEGLHVAAAKAAAVATATWRGAQMLLNVALSSNPIGLVVMAISGLVTIMIIAYRRSDEFRQICSKVWTVGKNLASMVWDKLCKAFAWLGEKLKIVWTFIKGIFGIKSDPFVNLTSGANDASDALDTLKDKYENFNPKGSKGGGSAASATNEKQPLEGSIAYYEKKMQAANDAVNNAVTFEARKSAQDMADAYAAQINRIKAMVKGGIFGGKDIEGTNVVGITDFAAAIEKLRGVKIPKDVSKLWQTGDQTKASWQDAASAIQQAGQAMQNMGSPVLNVMGTIAQAIASIALGFAQATASDSKLGVWGWISAVTAGLATMVGTISSIKSATAFADGGVIYGPTLGLMGEYAGASSNPEIVAPLNKLQSIINPAGQMSGQVEFKLVGKELRGCLVNTNSRSSKIR